MKSMNLSLQLLVFFIVVIATQAFVTRPNRQGPGRNFPTFPGGTGPFNPNPTWPKPYPQYRFRRSSEVEGTVTETVIQPIDEPEREPSVSLDHNHRLYESPNGEASLTSGVAKNPGHQTEKNVAIQETIRSEPRRPDLFPQSAWDIDEYGRERVIP